MIRKLASGQFRLYSRKTDPKTGKRKNLGDLQKPSGRRGSRTCSAVFQAALKASRPSYRRKAAPVRRTRISVCMRLRSLSARYVRSQKKARRRSVAGKGESMLGSVRSDRSDSINGVKEEQEPRELRRCCAPRLPARQVPRGQVPAKPTNSASRTLRHFRGRERATLRSPNKLKFLASRCPCASPGACRRARSRESVPSRTWSSKRCARIIEILRFKELQLFSRFCLSRNLPRALVSARFLP